jgi:hypothetical protein
MSTYREQQQMENLLEDVKTLKKFAATQAPYNLLLQALAQTVSQQSRAQIEATIDQIRMKPSLENEEIRKKAKALISLHFL